MGFIFIVEAHPKFGEANVVKAEHKTLCRTPRVRHGVVEGYDVEDTVGIYFILTNKTLSNFRTSGIIMVLWKTEFIFMSAVKTC